MSQHLTDFISFPVFSAMESNVGYTLYVCYICTCLTKTNIETQAKALNITCFCPEFGQLFSSEGQVSYLRLGGQ